MRRLYTALLLCFVGLFFFQCQKEVSYIGGPDPGNLLAPDPITSNITGNVFDENGSPAVGVTVKVGNKTTATNSKGYFRINGATLDKKSSLITAEKPGYFKAFRSFAATSGTNQVVIRLIAKQLTGTVAATAGGDVALSNGTKVTLPANAVVTASTNAPYTGVVNVYMSYIDPSSPEMADIIPGSLMARDKNGDRVTLLSYGMVAVDLEGSGGEKLQIKSGVNATLTTAIPSAALASAPATIPLWSIDENTGLWKEEGVATKNGNVYIGQVSHFSFWNCDAPFPVTYISMTFKNQAGLPLVHARVRVIRNTNAAWGTVGYGITDTLGQVGGLMPMNEPLLIEVLDQCNNVFFSQNVGPFSAQTNLGVITIANTGSSVVTLSGKLLNCSNNPVTNGYAIISNGNWVRYAAVDASGIFETTVMHCNASGLTYNIIGVDNGAQQQGAMVTGNMTIPSTQAGNISVCGVSTTQFINYTLDGNSFTIGGTPGDSTLGYTSNQGSFYTSIQGMTPGTINSFSVYFMHSAAVAGTYPVLSVSARNVHSANQAAPVNAVITSFPTSAGLYYEGTVSGSFTDSSAVSHTINASFRVRRVQ